jgi:hypothetical protein
MAMFTSTQIIAKRTSWKVGEVPAKGDGGDALSSIEI